jgi:hypothetical protein
MNTNTCKCRASSTDTDICTLTPCQPTSRPKIEQKFHNSASIAMKLIKFQESPLGLSKIILP